MVCSFTRAKVENQPKCSPRDEQIRKIWLARAHTHTHMLEHVSATKNKILKFSTGVTLEDILLSRWTNTRTA